MKYFARATKQMRTVDGILTFQFPWPNRHFVKFEKMKTKS